MSKKKRKKQKKDNKYLKVLCLFLVTLILSFAYIMKEHNNLEPQLNELTTSYISFNNSNVTDRLTISNLKNMSERIGKSKWNESRLIIPISGDKNRPYEIIIYPINKDTNEEYIEIYIQHKKENIRKKLSELESSTNGGKILYQGKVDHSSVVVNMWISNKYRTKDDNNSFEIKIVAR